MLNSDMIHVTISRAADDTIRKIEINGHADYAENGYDIICAAVSALAINMANSVESFTDDPFDGKVGDDGEFSFEFTGPSVSGASQLLAESLVLGLESVKDEYGAQYINFRYREV